MEFRLDKGTGYMYSYSPDHPCANNGSRLFNVTKEHLHYLVWNHSTIKVSKMFNVSDVAIAKRCKLLGINKPPRGYWAKLSNNKLKVDLRGLYGSR